MIRYDKARRCFVVNGATKLPGLTKLIRPAFFPHYAYKKAVHGPVAQRPHRTRGGMCRGRRVDREIGRITDLLAAHPEDLDITHFTHETSEVPKHLKTPVKQKIARLRKNMHVFTRALCIWLLRHQYRPFATQTPVGMYGGGARVATAVDLMCKNKDGKMILVEIKTGFDKYYERHTGHKLLAPFNARHDSPHCQHQIQLAFTASLFRKTYKSDVHRAMVVVVHESGVEPYPLEDWASGAVEAGYAALISQTRTNPR